MRNKLSATLICLSLALQAKAADTLKLTLSGAIQYALEHNEQIQASQLDITKANYRIKEITASGFPQLNGSADFRDNVKLPVFVFPDPMTGEQKPIKVGTRYQVTGGLQLNQLIFDGSYFVGLKAAKEYKALAIRTHQKNEQDLKVNVAKAYLLALISKENLTLLDENLKTLSQTLTETEAMYKEGFVESLEVERLKLTVSNLQVQKIKLQNAAEITLNLLKTYLGLELDMPLVLEENLEALYAKYLQEGKVLGVGNVNNRLELKILETQKSLYKLDVSKHKVQYYPSIRGFANYQEQFYGSKLTFDPWLNTFLYGVTIQVPIFSSGMKIHQTRQAKITLQQAELNYNYTANMLKMERVKAEKEYNISLSMLEIQKANFELAKKINETTLKKYQEGVGSNLEVVTANQDLKNAQTNYLEAIYEVLTNRLNLIIANGDNVSF